LALNIETIFEKIMLLSGQFLINTNKIEINPDRFRLLVDDALATYSKYVPYDQHLFIDFSAKRVITLSNEFIYSLTNKDYLGTPDWISDVQPIRLYGINPFYIFKNLDPNFNNNLQDKVQMPFQYRKPDLYVSVSAEWDAHAVWRHKVIERQTEQDGFVFEVPTIDIQDQSFFKLLQGMFLQGLGRSRRAFTLNDLPITMDAAEIASEGAEIVEKTMEDIEDHQKFYLAWGG
jgi:hypothetical protein